MVELHKTHMHIRFGKNTHMHCAQCYAKNLQLIKSYMCVKRLIPVTDAITAK